MTAPHPIPEAPETLAAQLAWLLAGRRRAVLVTVGAATCSAPVCA